MSTYTEFGPDRLRFAGLIPERLIFRPKKSLQYRLSAYKKSVKYVITQMDGQTDGRRNRPTMGAA